ncbi:MAG: ThuA domain-containing protein [Sphingobacteriaceae bacterium]
MYTISKTSFRSLAMCMVLICLISFLARAKKPAFRVIAFYTAKADDGHIDFVHEANKWFPKMAEKYNFSYDSTNNWSNLNAVFLKAYQVVVFLDTRPEAPEQRAVFQQYMEDGGGWMGFHFAAFALTPSEFPQNWDWYHNTFLGSGQYGSNTWRPTPAILRIENRKHPAMKNLPETFKASTNEWYRWENDLRKNPDIEILASIDATSFPLGTGPKLYEIWHTGYYPVVWTNRNYKMLYLNMGHNDLDYDTQPNKSLSSTFESELQNKMVIDGLFWLGKGKKRKS